MLAVLSACAPETQDQIARNAAKSAVNRVVLERYPGLPIEPAINCVIDNATAQQIYALAADSVTGPTAATGEIVAGILQQPATVRCLADSALVQLAG
ncbi:hypothetical protein SAMN05421759_104166 [Roseivivax lentus]|uniref:Succinate dehydrogenase n=2 Tax=Roseivivax lentus TaxID=633194 RepID=A0A1N7MBZ3_9RHOB|nr:hypothetical protein SAMN05421759_104166 [Roseivivax lentus]